MLASTDARKVGEGSFQVRNVAHSSRSFSNGRQMSLISQQPIVSPHSHELSFSVCLKLVNLMSLGTTTPAFEALVLGLPMLCVSITYVHFFSIFSASGGELYQTVVLEERLHEKHVIRMMRQVLEGVSFLHERNIVHLDVKVSLYLRHLSFCYHGCIKCRSSRAHERNR